MAVICFVVLCYYYFYYQSKCIFKGPRMACHSNVWAFDKSHAVNRRKCHKCRKCHNVNKIKRNRLSEERTTKLPSAYFSQKLSQGRNIFGDMKGDSIEEYEFQNVLFVKCHTIQIKFKFSQFVANAILSQCSEVCGVTVRRS